MKFTLLVNKFIFACGKIGRNFLNHNNQTMTAIASWVNKEQPNHYNIWTIGDTKVTDSNNSTLTLENSKVFEITLNCFDLSTLPPRRLIDSHSIGFAYAGSCLVGLNTFATLNTVFGNLGGKSLPDLESLAEKALKIIDYYTKSLCTVQNPFEAIIYGYCKNKKKLDRYHIYPRVNSLELEMKLFTEEDDLILLGDKKNEINELIAEFRETIEDQNSIKYWRSPLTELSRITTEGTFETIGGGTQLNIADKSGCVPYQSFGEKNRNDMRFRNIDITQDIGLDVGKCLINIDAIDYCC